ncbi:hypothetical protein KSD_36160 [Ktedonobacter sp. SOSP1-85]|nr:hypothetical protein KSD_36160 [Ktedonobacter sp. SOSP1-85]
MRYDDAFSNVKGIDGAPLRNDCPNQFVSKNNGGRCLACDFEDVRTAQATAVYTYKKFVIINSWHWSLLNCNVIMGVVNNCFHIDSRLTGPFCERITSCQYTTFTRLQVWRRINVQGIPILL